MLERKRGGMILLLVFLSACSTLFVSREGYKDEMLLRRRVEACWRAKLNKNWTVVYKFMCQNYKKHVSKDRFIASANLNLTGFRIQKVRLFPEEKRAKVLVSFDIEVMGFAFKGARISEDWVWEKGNWFVCPSPEGFRSLFEPKRKGK